MSDTDEGMKMQLKVIRKEDGKFLFAEVNADFVNMLNNLKHVSIGELARIAMNDNVMQTLQDSCKALPAHLFLSNTSKSNKKKETPNTTITDLMKGSTTSKPKFPQVNLQTHSMTCTQNGNTCNYTCTPKGNCNGYIDKAVAFRNLGNSFEVAVTLPSCSHNLVLGILPDDGNLSSRLATQNLHNCWGFFLDLYDGTTYYPAEEKMTNVYGSQGNTKGKEVRMRFNHKEHKLEYSYNGNEWIQPPSIGGFYISHGTKCCPVILSSDQLIFKVTLIPNEDTRLQETFKKESSFLITNELKVTDSCSFTSHVQLLQRYQVQNVLSLQTTTIEFTPTHLQKLIAAIFNGERNVLEYALSSDGSTGGSSGGNKRRSPPPANAGGSNGPPRSVDVNMADGNDVIDIDDDDNKSGGINQGNCGNSLADWSMSKAEFN